MAWSAFNYGLFPLSSFSRVSFQKAFKRQNKGLLRTQPASLVSHFMGSGRSSRAGQSHPYDNFPRLLRHYTPPGDEEFQLKLPPGKGMRFAKAYEVYKESNPVQVVTHQVKRGETLFSIARYYGQKVSDLMALNSLTTPRLRVGQRLLVILEGLGKIR